MIVTLLAALQSLYHKSIMLIMYLLAGMTAQVVLWWESFAGLLRRHREVH